MIGADLYDLRLKHGGKRGLNWILEFVYKCRTLCVLAQCGNFDRVVLLTQVKHDWKWQWQHPVKHYFLAVSLRVTRRGNLNWTGRGRHHRTEVQRERPGLQDTGRQRGRRAGRGGGRGGVVLAPWHTSTLFNSSAVIKPFCLFFFFLSFFWEDEERDTN